MRFLTNYAKSCDLRSIMRNRNIAEYQKPCLKCLQRKALAYRSWQNNGKYVFEIQPTIIIWIITEATSITQTRMTQIPHYSCKPELNFQWFSWPNFTEIYPDTLNSSLPRTVFCFPSEFELPVVIISSLWQWLLTISMKETTVKSISVHFCCNFTPNFANYHTRLMSTP